MSDFKDFLRSVGDTVLDVGKKYVEVDLAKETAKANYQPANQSGPEGQAQPVDNVVHFNPFGPGGSGLMIDRNILYLTAGVVGVLVVAKLVRG